MGKDKAITVKRADCDMVNNAFFALMNKSVQMLNDWAGKDSGLFKNATAFEIEKFRLKLFGRLVLVHLLIQRM